MLWITVRHSVETSDQRPCRSKNNIPCTSFMALQDLHRPPFNPTHLRAPRSSYIVPPRDIGEGRFAWLRQRNCQAGRKSTGVDLKAQNDIQGQSQSSYNNHGSGQRPPHHPLYITLFHWLWPLDFILGFVFCPCGFPPRRLSYRSLRTNRGNKRRKQQKDTIKQPFRVEHATAPLLSRAKQQN